MMFNAQDLNKVKSVKREGGTGWAYFDNGMEDTFELNFSKDQLKGARELKPGEVILLFQRVDKVPNVKDHTYLTHLVTPIDTVLFKNETLPHIFKWERKVAVIGRANPRDIIYSTPKELSFYKPQRGKVCDVKLLNDEKERETIQNEVWNHFEGHFNPHITEFLENLPVPDSALNEDIFVNEGAEKEVYRRHLSRERNPIIIGLAKDRALKRDGGKIICECCSFDFTGAYGEHGYGFIECHHRIPIATGGERVTRPEDLAMLCANCHRMIHRRKKKKIEYYTVEELKNVIDANRIV